MLEPRLLEYVYKKKYYRMYNLYPEVNPEKEFSITKDDIEKITKYLREIKEKNRCSRLIPFYDSNISYNNRLHYGESLPFEHNPNSQPISDYILTLTRDPPYMACKDTQLENELALGMPTHTNKTYGYNDAFAHSFNYIDTTVQNPCHTVLPFPRGGVSSRLENKVKECTREIYDIK